MGNRSGRNRERKVGDLPFRVANDETEEEARQRLVGIVDEIMEGLAKKLGPGILERKPGGWRYIPPEEKGKGEKKHG